MCHCHVNCQQQVVRMPTDSRASVQRKIDLSLFLTNKYEWLVNSSNLDFFVNSVWEKLPLSWQDSLTSVEPPEFSELLGRPDSLDSSGDTKYRTLWPLSLLALRAIAAHLSIPREYPQINSDQWQDICVEPKLAGTNESRVDALESDIYSTHPCKRARISNENDTKKELSPSRSLPPDCAEFTNKGNEPQITPCLTHPRLKQLFHKHVKPKKRHEISKLALTVATTAASSGCTHIVDIGSGVGHLSRMLAYGYGLKVCCIEGQEALSEQALRLDIELEQTASKRIPKDEMSKLIRPVHINLSLESHSDPQTLLMGVKSAFGTGNEAIVCGIVGLHTCGDLAAMLLRTFLDSSEILFINLVGCCFMKLTTELSPAVRGFPMSEFVSQRAAASHRHLGYEARAVACHANETYRQQLLDGNYADLKVHCYRATLEEIISVRWPHLRHSNIASVKCTPDMTFDSYCESALARLGVRVPPSDLSSVRTSRNVAAWKRVVNFVTVRLMLAPVVETIVLLDRLLYVREQGHSSWLAPLFDPRLSPRNHVLTAVKK